MKVTNKQEILDKILGLWEKYAPRYADSFGGVSMFKDFAEKMKKSLLPVPGGIVLDGGCGPGLHFGKIIQATKPKQLIGLDYSPTMLREANKVRLRLNRKYKCQIDLREADLLRGMPFPENYFDAQIFHLVDYYLPFEVWKEMPKERFRVAKPGGYVVTSNFLRQFDFRKEIGGWAFIKEMALHPRAIFWTILRARPVLVQFQDLVKKRVLNYPSEAELITVYKEAGFENIEVTERLWRDTGAIIRTFKPK